MGIAIVFHLLIAAQMWLAHVCVAAARTMASAWFWVLAIGLGFPGLLFLLPEKYWSDLTVGAFATWSFVFYVAAVAIAHSEKKLPLGPPFVPSRAEVLRARTITLLPFTAVLIWVVLPILSTVAKR